LANAFARSDSPKTPVKAHPCAGGFILERSWTSCFLDERIPGFSNRWYRVAMDAATPVVSELGDPSCDRAVLPSDEN
jgi:hypothetical protein